MSFEKVAIKNQRPGVMVTPGLRPPDETDTDREDERLATETTTLAEVVESR
jgi:hypothetical protein